MFILISAFKRLQYCHPHFSILTVFESLKTLVQLFLNLLSNATAYKEVPLGNTFQAIVSVTAVKIQLSSPSGVRRSFSLPGILMTNIEEIEIVY